MDTPTVSRETLIDRYFPANGAEIRAFAELLSTAGIERGLIGPREGEIIWERHIFNSLPVSTLIPEGASVIDLGSGAGLPGIPLALARPDLTITLVEPLQRRIDFLEEACRTLKVEVVRGRGEELRLKADFVVARAVAPLAKLKAMSWHMINKGGALLAIKGQNAADELTPGAQLHEIHLDGLEVGRVISIQKPG